MSNSNKEYFERGKTWEQEIVSNALQARNRAWIVAISCMVISVLSLLTLLFLLPLKTFEPYVITVDQATGYYEVSRGLIDSDLSSDQAVTESNLVRYVSMREQYNYPILKQNYESVVLMSGETALSDYRELWDGENPNNPSKKYGPKVNIDVKIKSVSFIDEKIAQVRFLRQKHTPQGITETHWNAVLQFQYTQKPTNMKDRFENPLGFQVVNYRVNPETLESIR